MSTSALVALISQNKRKLDKCDLIKFAKDPVIGPPAEDALKSGQPMLGIARITLSTKEHFLGAAPKSHGENFLAVYDAHCQYYRVINVALISEIEIQHYQ